MGVTDSAAREVKASGLGAAEVGVSASAHPEAPAQAPGLSIGEVAAQAGLATSAVRYYESLGLIESERTMGGQRRYKPSVVRELRSIGFARSAGFTLAEVATLHQPLDAGLPLFASWKGLAEQKLAELDELIKRAEEMKSRLELGIRCRCIDPEDCPILSD